VPVPEDIFRKRQNRKLQEKESEFFSDIGAVTEPLINSVIFLKNVVTGGNKKYFDDVDEIYSNPMITSGNPVADTSMQINRVVTPDLTQNIESYISNGAQVAKDPNGDLLVFFKNGEYGYHNAPGLSKVDMDQFINTGVGFGFASKVNKGINKLFKLNPYGGQFLRNVQTNIANAVTFSIGQDFVASLTGSKSGIQGDKLIFNVAGSLVAPIIGLVPSAGIKMASSESRQIINSIAPRFLNKEGNYSQEAIKELESLGIGADRLGEYSEKDLNVFAQALELGYEKDLAKAYMNSSKFGIDLFDAQVMRNQDALQKLNEGLKGAYGADVQLDLTKIVESQNEQLKNAVIQMSGLPEDFDFETMSNAEKNELGNIISGLVQESYEAKQKFVDDAYEMISGNLTILPEDATMLKGNAQSILKQSFTDAEDPFFSTDYPKSSSIYNRFTEFERQVKSDKGKDFQLLLKQFQKFRSSITSDVTQASGKDSSLANELLVEFDRFQEDIFSNSLKYTDRMTQEQLESFTTANDAYREMQEDFMKQKTTSLGKVDQVGSFIQRVLNEQESPMDILKTINGLKDVKNTKLAVKKIDAVYNLLEALPEEERIIAKQQLSDTLKESFHLNLVDSALKKNGGAFAMNPVTYHRQVQQYLADSNLKTVMSRFMSEEEINSLDEFSKLVKDTTPGKFDNASNTASTLLNIMRTRGISKDLMGNMGKLYAYNTGGLKGLFTYRTISSFKGIPSKELDELNITKTLEQIQGDIPDDIRNAIGFGLTTRVGQEGLNVYKLKSVEDILNYKIPVLKTTDDIKEYQKQVTGISSLPEDQQKEMKKRIENKEKIKRILR